MIECQICQNVFNSDTTQAFCFHCGHLCLECIRRLRKVGCPLNCPLPLGCRPPPRISGPYDGSTRNQPEAYVCLFNLTLTRRVYVDFTEIAEVRDCLVEREGELKEKEGVLRKMEAKLEKKEAELAYQDRFIRELKKQFYKKGSELEENEAELENKKAMLGEKNKIIRELKEQFTEKQSELEEKEAELEEKEAKLEEKGAKVEDIIRELEERLRQVFVKQQESKQKPQAHRKREKRPSSSQNAEGVGSDELFSDLEVGNRRFKRARGSDGSSKARGDIAQQHAGAATGLTFRGGC